MRQLRLRYCGFIWVFVLGIAVGCNVQIKELPETDMVVACREEGFQRGSQAFEDCVSGGVEAPKPLP